jgi:toxin ParE1/3/4
MAGLVVWSQLAIAQLEQITAYISEDNPAAAQALTNRIVTSVERLAEHPYMFRTGRKPGTREMVVHPNYLIIYRVEIELVDIVSVLHARREYP